MPSFSFVYLFSSSPNNGALNINSDGSAFSVNMARYPISMPHNCKNVTAAVIAASIPYISPNVITPTNDQFNFNYLGTNYQIIIPTGLYSLNSLQNQINLGLAALSLPQAIFTFIGNGSTQKVSIQFNYTNTYIDFTGSNTFRDLMGFNAVLVPLAPSTAGQIETAPNVANFDTLQSYTIATSLLNNGIPFNGTTSKSIVSIIPINGVPGSRLIYQPTLPVLVNANELISQSRTVADFQILDQDANPINMLNQIWTVTIQFTYDI